MDFSQYQQAALKTDQPPASGTDPVIVPLLGLLGEAGSVATVYKKRMRDGARSGTLRRSCARNSAMSCGTSRRWPTGSASTWTTSPSPACTRSPIGGRPPPASRCCSMTPTPRDEQLPRTARFTLTPQTGKNGRTVIALRCDGQLIGDPLTDASHIDDDYRLHDVFHISYAAVLGWSPVLRSLLKRKRKSNPQIDEAEDGGRAIAIEEGISALVFSYAARHEYLQDIHHVDHELLTTIGNMVSHLEVSTRRAADWEAAIITGFAAWRQLRANGGHGNLDLDMHARTLEVT